MYKAFIKTNLYIRIRDGNDVYIHLFTSKTRKFKDIDEIKEDERKSTCLESKRKLTRFMIDSSVKMKKLEKENEKQN